MGVRVAWGKRAGCRRMEARKEGEASRRHRDAPRWRRRPRRSPGRRREGSGRGTRSRRRRRQARPW
eukprot:scaffold91326_cov36-Phaeocystis_antarctica.AAC.2